MPRKGQVLTKPEKLKISDRTRQAMQQPDVRQHLKDSFTAERREQISIFHKEDALRPERIARSIDNLPQTQTGNRNPNWRGGLKTKNCSYCGTSFQVIPALFNSAKYCSYTCKNKAASKNNQGEKNSNWRGGHYKNCEYCGAEFWVMPSTEKKRHYCSRSCRSKGLGTFKRLNNNPEFQQKRLKAAIKQPNRQEQKLEAILGKRFPGEWKFVGDGEVILGSLNPDFINCNGRKQIIELFGCWYHGCPIHHPENKVKWQDMEIGKRTIYARYGFETLVIWEHELEGEKVILDRVDQFMARTLTKKEANHAKTS